MHPANTLLAENIILENILQNFNQYLQAVKRLSHKTCESYLSDITLFLRFSLRLNHLTNIANITDKHCNQWVESKHDSNHKATSRRRAIASLKCFSQFLLKNKIIEVDFAKSLSLPKIAENTFKSIKANSVRDIITAIENDEIFLLGQMCQNAQIDNSAFDLVLQNAKLKMQNLRQNLGGGVVSSLSNKQIEEMNLVALSHKNNKSCEKIYNKLWQIKRTKAIVYLIYAGGLRISEALLLKSSALSRGQCEVKIVGKGEKERIVPLVPQCFTIIEDYAKFCPHNISYNSFVFVGSRGGAYSMRLFQKEVEALRKQGKLPQWFTPHSFRHCFATHLMENGADIKAVQDLLGHASLSTTQRYIKIDKQKIKNAQKFLAS